VDVFGLIDGGHAGFTTPRVITALVLALLAIAACVVVQARVPHPMAA
jgi:DHA2 family methylenomycin A resistance protein-like MFS transporter